MRLTVTYTRPEDLLTEHDEQMKRGGLLVRGEPPAGVALFQDVELAITGAFLEEPVVVKAQVVQVIAGIGVAVAFDPAPLAGAVAAARNPRPPRVEKPVEKPDIAAKIQA